MVYRLHQLIGLVLALSALTSCVLAAPQERVAIERAIRTQQPQATVRATHPLPDGTLLVYYTVGGEDGTRPTLECDTVLRRVAGTWTGGGGGGCGERPAGLPRDPFVVSAAGVQQSGDVAHPFHYGIAYGLATDPAITHVTMTLANGAQHTVVPSGGFYLLVSDSDSAPQQIQALDATGRVLYHRNLP